MNMATDAKAGKMVIVLLAALVIEVGGGVAVYEVMAEEKQPALVTMPVFDPAKLTAQVLAAKRDDNYSFVVVGDSKHASVFARNVVPFIAQLNPDFVVTTGDMVNSGSEKCWRALADEAGKEMQTRPWWPAAGNHERDTEGMDWDGFLKFYNLKATHYSFTFRNAAFIVLPYGGLGSEILGWCEDELKKANAEGKIIFVCKHDPFYSVEMPGESLNKPTACTKIFQKYGVMAVFSGHDHGYYRTIRDNVAYVTSAGAGAMTYSLQRRSEALPEDVYFGASADADAKPSEKYVFVNGVTRQTRTYANAQPSLCLVRVEGRKVSLTAMTISGEVWEKMELSPKK